MKKIVLLFSMLGVIGCGSYAGSVPQNTDKVINPVTNQTKDYTIVNNNYCSSFEMITVKHDNHKFIVCITTHGISVIPHPDDNQ